MKAVVSGSFRKFYDGIAETVSIFEDSGIKVLSPKISQIKNPGEEFAILESDTTTDIKTLEQNHLDAISKADFLYVYDPQGVVGMSTMMEIGWALAIQKPIFALETPIDVVLAEFIQVQSVEETVLSMKLR